MNKTSMSVMEMGRSLGLGKTDSYWLIHKEQFETRIVAGKMRVMVESFEKWYANQLHYKKVNGELPGAELLQRTMTILTMANLLGISEGSAYDLIHRLHRVQVSRFRSKNQYRFGSQGAKDKNQYPKGVLAKNSCRNAQSAVSGNSRIQGTVRR